MEIERISSRNLGRDDRIISDHAKESRFPYLDEHLVSFLNQTPLWLKVFFLLMHFANDCYMMSGKILSIHAFFSFIRLISICLEG